TLFASPPMYLAGLSTAGRANAIFSRMVMTLNLEFHGLFFSKNFFYGKKPCKNHATNCLSEYINGKFGV
ncbi:hypothetical protein, partial [uncultured Fibrobacter sp.]|uniref:hypothetical protein n=1 Tax=uncultured Fibrobacter sp. TaxID=261512 RepID=UPI0026071D05